MSRKKTLIPEAQQALDSLKTEIASQMGVDISKKGALSAKDSGSVGGEMVKRMIALAEQSIK